VAERSHKTPLSWRLNNHVAVHIDAMNQKKRLCDTENDRHFNIRIEIGFS
jgi:hypothetical protein